MDFSWLNFSGLHMNRLDIILGLILILTIARGIWTGFSRTFSTLLGVFLGLWVAVHYFPSLALRLSPFIHDPLWRPLAAFFLMFIIIYLAFVLTGMFVNRFLRSVKLGWVDRLMGAVIGLVKGLVLAGALAFLLTVLLPGNSPLLKDSLLYPRLVRVAKILGNFVPEDMKGCFMWKWRRINPEPGHLKGVAT